MRKIKFYVAKIRGENLYFRNKHAKDKQLSKKPQLYNSIPSLLTSVRTYNLKHGKKIDWIIIEYEGEPKKIIEVNK